MSETLSWLTTIVEKNAMGLVSKIHYTKHEYTYACMLTAKHFINATGAVKTDQLEMIAAVGKDGNKILSKIVYNMSTYDYVWPTDFKDDKERGLFPIDMDMQIQPELYTMSLLSGTIRIKFWAKRIDLQAHGVIPLLFVWDMKQVVYV